MTRDDALELVDRLFAVWPTPRAADEAEDMARRKVWREYFEALPDDVARVALRNLEATSKSRPGIPDLQKAARAVWHGNGPSIRLADPTDDLPPAKKTEPNADAGFVHDAVARLKEELSGATPRVGGPDPDPRAIDGPDPYSEDPFDEEAAL